MTLIFKIIDAGTYGAAQKLGQFLGAEIDLKDGYIHFSTAEQVVETAQRHFAERHNLLLLAISAEALGADLKWEPSRGGQLFPHLYGPLAITQVNWAKPLAWNGTTHDFPTEVLA